MWEIAFYFSVLLLYLLLSRKKSILTKYLVVVFMTSAIAALAMAFFYPDCSSVKYTHTYLPLFLLVPLLLIWFNAFSKCPSNYNGFLFYPLDYKFLAKAVAIVYLPMTIWVLYNTISVLSVVDFAAYRTEESYSAYIKGRHLFLIASWFAPFFFVPQLLLFISINKKYRLSSFLKSLLLFDSLIYVFYCFFYAGRDGMLFWIMNALLMYYMFKESYSEKSRKVIKVSIGVISALGLILFFAITISRFVMGGELTSLAESEDMVYSIVFYIGQQPFVFCQTFMNQFGRINTSMELEKCFGYFINNFVVNLGVIGATIITFVLAYLIKQTTLSYKKNHSFWTLLIIFAFYQVPLCGVFYYRQALGDTQLVYIIFIVLCYFVSQMGNRTGKPQLKNC